MAASNAATTKGPKMICGHCHQDHPTVADVKACYAGQGNVTTLPRPTNEAPASEKQLSFISKLIAERTPGTEVPAGLTKSGASRLIDELLAVPATTAPAPTPSSGQVPSGRYAIEMDGVLKFYRVNTPTEGKWAGRTFVDVMASDELHSIRNRESREAILAEILRVGPREASGRYGHELGHCGVCGRTLTDAVSRERGIGPVCWEVFG
jgi:hypothetical protein